MGRLRLAAIECNYKEIDRQLKEQFIHRLNDTDILAEIIMEVTKIEETTEITSEKILCLANKTAQGSVEESSIVSVNVNSIHFSKNHLVITANLKTLANKNSTIVPYKVHTGSDGNIMSLHIYKKLFPGIINKQLVTKIVAYN